MVSDVLRDAIEEIEGYQREVPVLYDPMKFERELLKKRMWELIVKLHDPPGR